MIKALLIGFGFMLMGPACICWAHQAGEVHHHADYSSAVEKLLAQKVALIRDELSNNRTLIEYIRSSNESNKMLSKEDIFRADEEWMKTEGVSPFMKQLISNEGAGELIKFEDRHFVFSEIFLTGARGLIIATTNKTSDYYQADEEWWQQAYNKGAGRSFFGEIEYDTSAMVEVIPYYAPVLDPGNKKVIGVLKVLINITSLKFEL